MTIGGFFDLSTPRDLFQKLEHDYQRVIAAPGDRYAAMDFVIVANHLQDWVERHDRRKISGSPLLRICRELANNSKHFVRRHDHIKDEKVVGGAFQFGAFDSTAFDVGFLALSSVKTRKKSLGARSVLHYSREKLWNFGEKNWTSRRGGNLVQRFI